jgi:hypothetical protein
MDDKDARFAATFAQLKGILEPYAARMFVSTDTDTWYGLDLAPEA